MKSKETISKVNQYNKNIGILTMVFLVLPQRSQWKKKWVLDANYFLSLKKIPDREIASPHT